MAEFQAISVPPLVENLAISPTLTRWAKATSFELKKRIAQTGDLNEGVPPTVVEPSAPPKRRRVKIDLH